MWCGRLSTTGRSCCARRWKTQPPPHPLLRSSAKRKVRGTRSRTPTTPPPAPAKRRSGRRNSGTAAAQAKQTTKNWLNKGNIFGSVFTLDPTRLRLRPHIMGRHEILYGNFGRSFQAGSRLFVLNLSPPPTPPPSTFHLPPAVSYSRRLDFMSMPAAFGFPSWSNLVVLFGCRFLSAETIELGLNPPCRPYYWISVDEKDIKYFILVDRHSETFFF